VLADHEGRSHEKNPFMMWNFCADLPATWWVHLVDCHAAFMTCTIYVTFWKIFYYLCTFYEMCFSCCITNAHRRLPDHFFNRQPIGNKEIINQPIGNREFCSTENKSRIVVELGKFNSKLVIRYQRSWQKRKFEWIWY
jgi:hypothetical protein